MRILDLLAATCGLLALSPLFLIIAVLIVATSPGPIFHRAQRVGRNGKVFCLYKFRSMVVGADKAGPCITTASDVRVTPVGRFLRKTKADELPQLLNVLNGEMSLVGPRPEDARYVALYTDAQRRVLAVRPGITSLASLAFRNEESLLAGKDWESIYVDRVLPRKLAIEIAYLSNRSLLSDLGIIVRTMIAVMSLPTNTRESNPERHLEVP